MCEPFVTRKASNSVWFHMQSFRTIRHTVGCEIPISRLAQRLDLDELLVNVSRTSLVLPAKKPGTLRHFTSHKHPISLNLLYHTCIVLSLFYISYEKSAALISLMTIFQILTRRMFLFSVKAVFIRCLLSV